MKFTLRPYTKIGWAFLLENLENRTKGENKLAIRTNQVHSVYCLREMVEIFKSLCSAIQALHHSKVGMRIFISLNRRENEHRDGLYEHKVHGQGRGGCATKEA